MDSGGGGGSPSDLRSCRRSGSSSAGLTDPFGRQRDVACGCLLCRRRGRGRRRQGGPIVHPLQPGQQTGAAAQLTLLRDGAQRVLHQSRRQQAAGRRHGVSAGSGSPGQPARAEVTQRSHGSLRSLGSPPAGSHAACSVRTIGEQRPVHPEHHLGSAGLPPSHRLAAADGRSQRPWRTSAETPARDAHNDLNIGWRPPPHPRRDVHGMLRHCHKTLDVSSILRMTLRIKNARSDANGGYQKTYSESGTSF